MKLLIVGSDHIWSIEKMYVKYLRELQVHVELFAAQNYFYAYYNRSVFHKIIHRLGLSGIIDRINEKLKKEIDHFQPQVIWVFKGMEITPSTLKWIRKKKILLVNYNPDNPFIFSGTGSGNEHITASIPLFDLHFTYNLEIKKELENRFHAQTALLPFGFDISGEVFARALEEPEIIKVCFLGNPDKGRADFIVKLLEKGIPVDVFGNGWSAFIHHPLAGIHDPVYGEAFWRELRKYRVQLNLMRIHNEHSHNMRSFEIPAIGGIQLAPDTPEHRIFFEEGKEIFLFRDAEDCVEKIKFLLALTGQQAADIREQARKKSLDAGYDYKSRAYYAKSVIKKWKERQ